VPPYRLVVLPHTTPQKSTAAYYPLNTMAFVVPDQPRRIVSVIGIVRKSKQEYGGGGGF